MVKLNRLFHFQFSCVTDGSGVILRFLLAFVIDRERQSLQCPLLFGPVETCIVVDSIVYSFRMKFCWLRIGRLLVQFCALCALAAAADFYKLLGVSRDATPKEIKKAYRAKSLEFHPDKNKAEGAAEKFAEIARAYEVLSDEDLKQVYDRHGEEGLKQHEQGGGGGGGGWAEDIFSQFGFNFHSQRRPQGERQTASVEIPLYVTLQQLYLGDTLEVEYVREVLCVHWKECMKDMQECQGPGVRVKMQQLAPGFVQQVQQRDDRCIARGKMWRQNCRECPNKTETEKIDLTIEITPGMRPGERITFEGVTDEKPGYTAGDLHFQIVEQPEDIHNFHRDRDDLYKTMDIPLVDALVSVDEAIACVSAIQIVLLAYTSPFLIFVDRLFIYSYSFGWTQVYY